MADDWRPYTIPYTGSGAVNEGNEGNDYWVPSSTTDPGNGAHPHPPSQRGPNPCPRSRGYSVCSAPPPAGDNEATAAKDRDDHSQPSQQSFSSNDPGVPFLSQSNTSPNPHDRFSRGPQGPDAPNPSFTRPFVSEERSASVSGASFGSGGPPRGAAGEGMARDGGMRRHTMASADGSTKKSK